MCRSARILRTQSITTPALGWKKSGGRTSGRKLKEDTDKLVQAANDLKEMIEKSNKDTFSISIVKKTEEVEKILKDIKRRAKGGF